MDKRFKNKKGITLIALVITIIILLILAGISIASLTGSGLLKKAGDAKNKTKFENLKEEVVLALGNRKIKNEMGNKSTLKEDLEEDIGGNKVIEQVVVAGEKYEDVCYVTRDGYIVTVYEDGSIENGKVDIWDGTSKNKPQVDENRNWHIYTTGEFKYFADFVNGNLTEEEKEGVEITSDTIVYLENNLDLGARQTDGVLEKGTQWDYIGGHDSTKLNFIGTFEGNGHKINGVYVNTTEQKDAVGIFGATTGSIYNLTVKDSYIKGVNNTGGIVGVIKGTIENCNNFNTIVTGTGYQIGGIVGLCSGLVKKCSNNGYISGIAGEQSYNDSFEVGGICGVITEGSIIDCTNYGKINGGSNLGGIVGDCYLKSTTENLICIDNCINNGEVSGCNSSEYSSDYEFSEVAIGGIVGGAYKINLMNSYNTGKVYGYLKKIGGIIGDAVKTSVRNSYNSGMVIGDAGCVGGILGSSVETNINYCNNIGLIVANGDFIGGITGTLSGTIKSSINRGNIISKGGKGDLGGICGVTYMNSAITIESCYNTGSIIREESDFEGIGGIVGYLSATGSSGTIKNNYNTGKIEIKGDNVTKVGGVLGRNVSDAFNIENNYYIEGTYKTGDNTYGEEKTAEEMKTQEFADLLNTGLEEIVWKIDAKKNNGYPIIDGLENQ